MDDACAGKKKENSRSVSIDSIRYIGNLSVGTGASDAHEERTLGLASSTLWLYMYFGSSHATLSSVVGLAPS